MTSFIQCGLDTTPLSGLQPASQPRRPPEAPAHTEGTLWKLWQACVSLCIQGYVRTYVSLPLWDYLSRSGVSVCLLFCLSIRFLGRVPLPLYPHLYVCVAVSVCVPISECLSIFCVSLSTSLSLCISLYQSLCLTPCLCVYGSLVFLPLSFFMAVCPSIPVDVSRAPSPWGLCRSLRLFCVSLCVCLAARRLYLCVGLSLYHRLWVSGSQSPCLWG